MKLLAIAGRKAVNIKRSKVRGRLYGNKLTLILLMWRIG
jgi:hypothetical protein